MTLLEISDLVLDVDETGRRRPVARADVVAKLRVAGDSRGARVAGRLPTLPDGMLDPDGVDAVLLRCHLQLQRLSEELQQGQRAAEVLSPLLAALRAAGTPRPRLVDVGCGLGQVLRWLSWHRPVGEVELVGCDLNAGMISAATALATNEALDCRFVHGDAFALPGAAEVVISTGFLHHLRGEDLVHVLSRQTQARAVVHWDIAPGPLTGLGARVFHWARMREPLARHDGVVSALRAHSDTTLVAALRQGLPEKVVLVLDAAPRRNPLIAVLRPVLALDPDLVEPFLAGCPPHLRRRLSRPA